MDSFFEKAVKSVTWKIWLFFLAVSLSLYAVMLVWTIPFIRSEAGGREIFDMIPLGYDRVYAKDFLEHLSKAGFNMYLHVQLPLDFFFPLFLSLMMLSLWVILNRLNNRTVRRDVEPKAGFLLLSGMVAPVFTMLCDYSENIFIALMLTAKPETSVVLVPASSLFSVLKSMSTVLMDTALIVFAIVIAFRSLHKAIFKKDAR
jgi:hypothetical protein